MLLVLLKIVEERMMFLLLNIIPVELKFGLNSLGHLATKKLIKLRPIVVAISMLLVTLMAVYQALLISEEVMPLSLNTTVVEHNFG